MSQSMPASEGDTVTEWRRKVHHEKALDLTNVCDAAQSGEEQAP